MAYTGGDVPFEEDAGSQIEDDATAYIQEALKKRLKLKSGKEVMYISYGPPKQGKKKRRIVCHLCSTSNISTASDLKKHLTSICHNTNLQRDISRHKFRKPFRLLHAYTRDGKHPITLGIHPGEDIPCVSPYYEKRLECKAWGAPQEYKKKALNSLIYNEPAHYFNEKYPLLGLEYIIVMLAKDGTVVFCALCKKKYLNYPVYKHVISIKHERNYILKHYPTLYERVVSLLKIPDEKTKERLVHYIFRKLYHRCETSLGKKRINSADYDAFQNRPDEIIQPILAKIHYHENTLNEERLEDLLPNLIEKCHKHKNALGHYPAFIPPPSVESLSHQAQKEAFWRQYKNIRNKALPQWTYYPDLKSERMNELRVKYEKYDNQPESHPNYKSEWKKYYTEKYQMLKKEGTPISEYDFERNWYPYWLDYLKECYAIESRKTQTDLRLELGLPVRIPTPSPSRDSPVNYPDNERPAQINDSGSEYRHRRNISNCFDDESNLRKEQNYAAREKAHEFTQMDYQHEKPLSFDQSFSSSTRKNSVQLLPVLRVLSAVEHRLGSLGPKCMELLEETLRKERTMQVEEMLANQGNFVFFEAVNLKLKSLLTTKSFADDTIETIRNLIDDIDNLLIFMQGKINWNRQNNTTNWSAENTKTSTSSNLQSSNGNQNYHGIKTKQFSVEASHSAPFAKFDYWK